MFLRVCLLVPDMSPERWSGPVSPQEQALTPRMPEPIDMNSLDVQEAEFTENNSDVQSSTPLTNDDDLTNLAWLQDRNLLKGKYAKNLQYFDLISKSLFSFYNLYLIGQVYKEKTNSVNTALC